LGDGATLFGRKSHSDRALPTIERDEVQRLVTREVRAHRARVVGMRRVLDLDDVGAEAGEHEARVRSRQEVAELQNAKPVARRSHVAPGSLASTSASASRSKYPISWRMSTARSPLSATWCSSMRCASCASRASSALKMRS